MLLVIAFIPFASSVISESSNSTATAFYALVMACASLFSFATWWHAAHHGRLVDPQLPKDLRRRQTTAPLLTAAIFVLSIGIAFLNADLGKLSWLLVLPATLYFGRQ
jgi:uncharacterized membrane protein